MALQVNKQVATYPMLCAVLTCYLHSKIMFVYYTVVMTFLLLQFLALLADGEEMGIYVSDSDSFISLYLARHQLHVRAHQ